MTTRLQIFLIFLLSTMAGSTLSAQTPLFRLSLDGEWRFKADSGRVGVSQFWFADSTDKSSWRGIQTPRFWEEYPGLANYDGWGWYHRTFNVPRLGDSLSIHFAGVDDEAVVWVNGIEMGSHTGYSEPFAVDITGAVRAGRNSIVVLVKDDGGGGGIYKPITLIEKKHLDELLKGEFFGTPAMRSADWVRDAVIYSVYLRSFSREGTFAGLEKRLADLKTMGVSVVWLMPIHPVGVKNRKGTLGSPYAVQDYYGINAEFGTMADFKRLLRATHGLGMKLIIDLVANHTSWDSELIKRHPEWFSNDRKGNIVSPNADWTDVADLDYAKPGLRKYMIEMMLYWVRDVGIDGFRCDVAEMVPTDFWEEARARLNNIKPVMMLSEGTAPEHHRRAFDVTYSWNVYDALPLLLQGKRPATVIDEILRVERYQFPTGSLRMRFNTNHDKNAWDMPAVLKYGTAGLKLSAVLVNTIPGIPLIYTGEEVANDRKLSLFEKVDIDWSRPREMGELYRTLSIVRRGHRALSRGEMIKLNSSEDQECYSFARRAGMDLVVTVLNFSSEAKTVTIDLSAERLLPGEKKVVLKEVFSRQKLELSSPRQVALTLGPKGYMVFTTGE